MPNAFIDVESQVIYVPSSRYLSYHIINIVPRFLCTLCEQIQLVPSLINIKDVVVSSEHYLKCITHKIVSIVQIMCGVGINK